MNSYDARIRYTRMMVEASFMKLVEKKHMSKITVTEICNMAQINRATFYRHYLDVPDILDQMEQSLFQSIRNLLSGRTYFELESLYADVLHYMKEEGMQYNALATENCDPQFPYKTFQLAQEIAFPILKENISYPDPRKLEMIYQYLSQGCAGILGYWVRNGMKEDPEEITAFMLKLCKNTVHDLT